MDEGHIRPFRFWVQHILPLAYDDSLSYLEVLYKVKIKLNEVVEWANSYQDQLYQYVEEKTKENLEQLQADLANYEAIVNGRLNDQDNRINSIDQRLDNQLNTVNSLINQFQTDINNQISAFTLQMQTDLRLFEDRIQTQIQGNEEWVKAQILIMQNQISATIASLNELVAHNLVESKQYTDEQIQALKDSIGQITSVAVMYPGDGQIVSIQEAVNRLYYDLSYLALTAKEYDDIGLTASKYDNYQLTAQQYDLWARYYLIGFGTGGSNPSNLVWIKVGTDQYANMTEDEKKNGFAYLVSDGYNPQILPWKFMTQDQYDALTTAQKNNGTAYFITNT